MTPIYLNWLNYLCTSTEKKNYLKKKPKNVDFILNLFQTISI